MNVSEAFLVNTKNFKSIIDSLVNYDSDDLVITSSLLKSLGYTDPNDLLVVRLLKEYKIIDSDGTAGKYFDEFRETSTTKKALAKGLIYANRDLFDQYPLIHTSSLEKSREVFSEFFGDEKTDLIVKYIASTFQHVVNYCDSSTIDDILTKKEEPEQEKEPELPPVNNNGVLTSDKENGNGSHNSNGKNNNLNKLVNGLDDKKNNTTMALLNRKENTHTDEDIIESTQEVVDTEQQEDNENPFGLHKDDTDAPVDSQETEQLEEIQEIEEVQELEETQDSTTEAVEEDHSETEAPEIEDEHEPASEEIKDEGVQDFIKKALFRKSDLLHKLQRWEDLLPTLDDIINRFDSEEYDDLAEAVSRSIIRRAMIFIKLNRLEEALPALNIVIKRFKNSENQEFYDQASKAMLKKVQILEKNGSSEILPLYNTIINRTNSESNFLSRKELDQIHIKRYNLISHNGEQNDILDASTKLINRFKDDMRYREYVQKAMIKRAEILDEIGRDAEAVKAYEDFLETFAS